MPSQQWYDELFDAIDDADADAFAAYFTEDGRFTYGSNPAVEGRDAVRDFVAEFLGTMRGTRHRLTDRWEHPDTLIMRGEVMYMLNDGRDITVPFTNIFGMRDDRIADYQVFLDPSPLAPDAGS